MLLRWLAMAALTQAFIVPSVIAETMLDKAEKFAVRVKTSIAYPFAEDEAGTFNGAGFLVDREAGWILTKQSRLAT